MPPLSRVGLTVAMGAVALLVVATVAAVLPLSTAAAAGRHHAPDLVVGAVDLTVAGRAVSGTVTVRNVGTARAGRSVTSVGGELIPTPALRPGRHARLVVATTLPPGATSVLTCVDVRHRVREQRERNNCRTYRVPATITPTATPSAPAPANPGVHASTGPVAF